MQWTFQHGVKRPPCIMHQLVLNQEDIVFASPVLGIMLALVTQRLVSPPQEEQFRVWIEPVGRIPHQWRLKDDSPRAGST